MRFTLTAAVLALLLAASMSANADDRNPYSGMQSVDTGVPILEYQESLLEAVKANDMGVVAQACADCGAKAVLGKDIPRNRVIMIFHPRFAVRMLEASVAAGIEAPLRLYLTEQEDGTARLTYRLPSHVFGAYEVAALDELGRELDGTIARIVDDAGR
ncbi:MAG: DUF302 domain-containing protein [Gammaproteobacteria bacterium]|nr:DUF302 domain-containing protein [Gammaproteobacteria bacterium]